MILNFDAELATIKKHLDSGSPTGGLEAVMVLATVFDKGMAFERKRCLDIIARKAINAADLRAEINRPVR